MKKRYSYILISYTFSLFLLCFNVSGYAIGIENGKTEQKIPDTQKNIVSEFDQKLFPASVMPDPYRLLNANAANKMRLDSIDEDKYSGTGIYKRKWYYHYDNNKLTSLEHFFFSDTYAELLNPSEAWYYNEDGQISKYEEKDKLFSESDSIFIRSLEENIYEGGLLAVKHSKQVSSYGSGTKMVNGELVNYYHVDYSENSNQYLYNEEKLLLMDYIDGSTDTNYYRYDAKDRLLLKIRKNPIFNYMSIEKHTYEETDTSKFDTEKYVSYDNIIDEAEIDTITSWSYEFSFDYIYDNQHRISVLISTNNLWASGDCQVFKTYFEYSPSGKKKNISIYYGVGAIGEELEFNEQARVEYTYDEYDNLLVYHRIYYDDLFFNWKTEELKTYYYSPTGVTTNNDLLRQKEFHVYPNPAKDYICLSGEPDNNSKYIIYNLMGNKEKEGVVATRSISVGDLKRGTYIIRVYNDTSIRSSRFVKY